MVGTMKSVSLNGDSKSSYLAAWLDSDGGEYCDVVVVEWRRPKGDDEDLSSPFSNGGEYCDVDVEWPRPKGAEALSSPFSSRGEYCDVDVVVVERPRPKGATSAF